METFEFWKTMNKQTRRFSSILSAGLALGAIAAVALGPGAEKALAQGQAGGDRIPGGPSDPSRPARGEGSMVNGGVTGEAVGGKKRVGGKGGGQPREIAHNGRAQ